MRVTEIHELNKVVVAYSGNAFWFDSMTEAEEFMRKIEDSLLFQQAIKKVLIMILMHGVENGKIFKIKA